MREGEPGALHLGRHAPGSNGPHHRRWDAVGLLVVKQAFKALWFRAILAMMWLASSALVVEAGQRWSSR